MSASVWYDGFSGLIGGIMCNLHRRHFLWSGAGTGRHHHTACKHDDDGRAIAVLSICLSVISLSVQFGYH